MSVDYSARAMIGVPINYDMIFKLIDVPVPCNHKNESGTKYCPNCGQKQYRQEEKSIIDLPGIPKGSSPSDIVGRLFATGGLALKLTDHDGEDLLFGLEARATEDSTNRRSLVKLPEDMNWIKSTIKAFLEPLGLWQESEFGLWSMLHISH